MNILILNPPMLNRGKYVREGRCELRSSSYQYLMPPISLPYIAALLLKNNYMVKIIDAIAEKYSMNNLIQTIKIFSPQLIIINISTPTYNNDILVLKRIKELIPQTYFCGIGVHVSSLPDISLKESELDFIIRGEPEIAALHLVKTLEEKKELTQVKGLSFKKDKTIHHNPDQVYLKELDQLPFPARHLLKNELYTLPVVNAPYTLIIPSRGCPYQCIFCTAKDYYGKEPRYRSVPNIIEELKEIIYTYKIKYVTMWSETFTFNKKLVIDLSQAIIKEKIPIQWMCTSRVDTIDEERLYWMAKAGCIGISYGIESGDQNILTAIKKNTTLEQIENAIRLTNKYNIESLAHVIFGLPGETEKTIKKTIKFIKKIKPSYAQFYTAIPYPNTEFYDMAIQNNWLITKNWDFFENNQAIISTSLLPLKKLKQNRKKAYLHFYISPIYIYHRLIMIKNIKDFILSFKQFVNFLYSWVFKS